MSAGNTQYKNNNKRLESPKVTLTWHARKYKVHKLHQSHILKMYIRF